MNHNKAQESTRGYPATYYESKKKGLIILLVTLPAIVFFLYKWMFLDDVFDKTIFSLMGAAAVIAIALIFFLYTPTIVTLSPKGFSYKKGSVSWYSDWRDVTGVYKTNNTVLIRTKLGWTRPISLVSLRKKGEKEGILDFSKFSMSALKAAGNIVYPKSAVSVRFLRDLEALSGKRIQNHNISRNENYRTSEKGV